MLCLHTMTLQVEAVTPFSSHVDYLLDRMLPAAAGSINLPGNKSQNYTFLVESDDDSLLFIDGKQVVSDTGVGRV